MHDSATINTETEYVCAAALASTECTSYVHGKVHASVHTGHTRTPLLHVTIQYMPPVCPVKVLG